MKIILTKEQQEKLLQWAGENAAAECDADVEPSGYRLEISVCVYGADAEVVWGTRRLVLGPVELVIQ